MKVLYSPIKSILFLVIVIFSTSTFSDVVVIVNKRSTLNTVNPKEIADLYLKKRKDLSGVTLEPLDLSEDSEIRKIFYEKVTKKSASQVKAYWSRLIFTGKGAPPRQYFDEEEIVDLVSEDKNKIGYVNASSVDERVKVVFVLP